MANTLNLLFVFLIATSLFMCTDASCANVRCSTGGCCDVGAQLSPRCYNPTQQTCAQDQADGYTYLCGLNESSCKGSCFNTTEYSCKNGKLHRLHHI
ncbi:hypothetical protein PROFUN_02103 [Planoprotostelium fungivorum]|uniref:Uncharacterized protein n=1 Tax=Planoprotostelium fungivorum TaxID=1890364 RepID=A0A2P6NZ68_9EUKA|nr:hypothetical protein PROFUN_02103 [Planoprotostelium fungivorum]